MAAEKKGEATIPEVDVLLKGMLSQPGVEGFMVYNDEGIPIKWTTTGFVKPGAPVGAQPIPPAVVHHAALLSDLCAKSKTVLKGLLGDTDGDLSLIRLHTKNTEMVIAPTHETTLVVVQKSGPGMHAKSLIQTAEALQALAAENATKAKK